MDCCKEKKGEKLCSFSDAGKQLFIWAILHFPSSFISMKAKQLPEKILNTFDCFFSRYFISFFFFKIKINNSSFYVLF